MNPYLVVFTLALLSSASLLNAMDYGEEIEKNVQRARQEKLQQAHNRDSASHFNNLKKPIHTKLFTGAMPMMLRAMRP